MAHKANISLYIYSYTSRINIFFGQQLLLNGTKHKNKYISRFHISIIFPENSKSIVIIKISLKAMNRVVKSMRKLKTNKKLENSK